jgi:hypothetical protein
VLEVLGEEVARELRRPPHHERGAVLVPRDHVVLRRVVHQLVRLGQERRRQRPLPHRLRSHRWRWRRGRRGRRGLAAASLPGGAALLGHLATAAARPDLSRGDRSFQMRERATIALGGRYGRRSLLEASIAE